MKIGDLVKLKRNDTLWIVVEICKLGNIGLWNPTVRKGLHWTYNAALEKI